MKLFHRLVLFLSIAATAASCGDKKDEPQLPAKRTLLVYMIATNSMNGQDAVDIAEMKTALATYAKSDCRLLIYRASYNQDPQLIELKYNKTASNALEQIKAKHYTEKLNAFSGEILLVGISYDESKGHSCIIEKIVK